MKYLHRLIVTSDAYRRVSSAEDSEAAVSDPENKLLWRMNRGRMEAEVVRDSLLFLPGRLDNHMGGQELENEAAFTTFRRTLYYSCQPELDGKSPFGALSMRPNPPIVIAELKAPSRSKHSLSPIANLFSKPAPKSRIGSVERRPMLPPMLRLRLRQSSIAHPPRKKQKPV